MSKVVVKKVKQGSAEDNKEIADMFNQMLGASEFVNIKVCYPKFKQIIHHADHIAKLAETIITTNLLNVYSGQNAKQELADFISSLNSAIAEFSIDLSDEQINSPSKEVNELFTAKYNDFKKSQTARNIISICNKLVPHKSDFEQNNINFLLNMPGDLIPYPGTSLDFRQLAVNVYSREDIRDRISQLIFEILAATYKQSLGFYKVITSPDIDVGEFSRVILKNIGNLKKQIPRCDAAFKKIENSIELLQNNFGNYYKDFLQTKNQTIILEEFIIDVSKSTQSTGEETRQFMTIVNHYKKLAKDHINDPKLKMVFDKISEQFDNLAGGNDENIKAAEQQERGGNETKDKPNQKESAAAVPDKYQEEREKNKDKSVDELAREIENMGGRKKKNK